MMSVVIAGRSSRSLSSPQRSTNRWLPHRRRIRRSTLSLPLCIEMCRCGQTFSAMVGHHVDQFAGNFGGLDAGEPHAEVAGQLGNRSHQVRQPRPVFLALVAAPVDAVVPQVNAGEHDFAIAVVDQPPDFVENVRQAAGWRAAAAPSG